jgi:ABC-2 type transport system permease protein
MSRSTGTIGTTGTTGTMRTDRTDKTDRATGRTGRNAIAAAEFRMLARNRVVAGGALLYPLAFGTFLYLSRNTHKGGGSVAGVQIVVMVGMGTYVTATTTLAARRQTLYLKRMRGAALSDRSIIAGLLAPLIMVNAAQLAIVLGVLASTDAPSNPLLLLIAIAIAIAEAMFAGLALATAGFSTSPEHAQYTTMPVFLTATAAAIWVQATGVDNLTAVKRTLPGGALVELITTAWNGGSLANVPLLLIPSLAWAVAGVLAARAFFRWEPRR